ncbi:MAG TPA: polyprenyl synthetase family protein, partial [Alphaproteobacteria bacterium]|nr:polyprenyl synthetase family protein [Alphaproteobacteria bacterium]
MKSAVAQKISSNSAVQGLHSFFESYMTQVNDLIEFNIKSAIPLAQQAASHMILAGGKRLRPLLTLSFYGLFCEEKDLNLNPCYLATAVEFIHTATLLHDDVIDNASKRRNFPTTNAVFGNTLSVLAGDFLFARAFELMVNAKSLTALEVLSKASCQIVEGEILQLGKCYDLNLDRQTALQV